MIGRYDSELFSSEVARAFRISDSKVLRSLQSIQTEETIPIQGRRAKTFISVKFPLLTQKGTAYAIAGFATDITQKKQMETERAKLYSREKTIRLAHEKTLQHLNEEKAMREQFVAILSHDLLNPLTAIQNASEILLKGEVKEKRVVLIIMHAANRMAKMLRDLLDVNQIQAGHMPPMDYKLFNAFGLISEVAEEFNEICGNRIKVLGDESIEGYWSLEGVRRILENLTKNAIKYGDPNRTIQLSIARLGKAVVFSVHNFGNPISKDRISHLFEAYTQFNSQKKKNAGWGLGLRLVRGMTEAHGGEVSVESTEESGTTFSVKLPIDCRDLTHSNTHAA
jgi:signal transduction histidine kinase